jgi:hypothetical protein
MNNNLITKPKKLLLALAFMLLPPCFLAAQNPHAEANLRLAIKDSVYSGLDSNTKLLLSSFLVPHHNIKLEVVPNIEELGETKNTNNSKFWELYKKQAQVGINTTEAPTIKNLMQLIEMHSNDEITKFQRYCKDYPINIEARTLLFWMLRNRAISATMAITGFDMDRVVMQGDNKIIMAVPFDIYITKQDPRAELSAELDQLIWGPVADQLQILFTDNQWAKTGHMPTPIFNGLPLESASRLMRDCYKANFHKVVPFVSLPPNHFLSFLPVNAIAHMAFINSEINIGDVWGQMCFPPDLNYGMRNNPRLVNTFYERKDWNAVIHFVESILLDDLYTYQPTLKQKDNISSEDLESFDKILNALFVPYLESCFNANIFSNTFEILELIVKFPSLKKYYDLAIKTAEKHNKHGLAQLWRAAESNIVYPLDKFARPMLIFQYQKTPTAVHHPDWAELSNAPFLLRVMGPIEPGKTNSMRDFLGWNTTEPRWALLGRDGKRILEGTAVPPFREFIALLDSKGYAPYKLSFEKYLRNKPDDYYSQLKLAAWNYRYALVRMRLARWHPSLNTIDEVLLSKDFKTKAVYLGNEDNFVWNADIDEALFRPFATYLEKCFQEYGMAWTFSDDNTMFDNLRVFFSYYVAQSDIMRNLAKKWLPELKAAIMECPNHKGLWRFAIFAKQLGLDFDFINLVDYPQPDVPAVGRLFEAQQGMPPRDAMSQASNALYAHNNWEMIISTFSGLMPPDPFVDTAKYNQCWISFGRYLPWAYLHTDQPEKASKLILDQLNSGGRVFDLSSLCEFAKKLDYGYLAERWERAGKIQAERK